MAKRQRTPDDAESDVDVVSDTPQDPPPKKARKETNASAQRTLFVRSLPAVASTEKLTELFSQTYPLKHATVVLDTETKQSKGYGFVTFADAEDCQRALEELNGQTFLGRKMKLEIAQPRSRDITKGHGAEGKKKSQISQAAAAVKQARLDKMSEDKKPPKLIIRNLPWSVNTTELLEKMFMKFGKVKHATLPKIKNKEETQAGFGFIVMRGRKNAEKALAAINGTLVDGRTVAVDWAVDKSVWETQKTTAAAGEDIDMGRNDDLDAKIAEDEDIEPSAEDDVANFLKKFGNQLESEDEEENDQNQDETMEGSGEENINEAGDDFEDSDFEDDEKPQRERVLITDNTTTLFVRNLPFTTLDPDLKEHFQQFGPVRYARVVMDKATDRPKGTGFVCFFNVVDADNCYRGAPRGGGPTGANSIAPKTQHSLLQDENADSSGAYTIEGRTLQISKAVERDTAIKLSEQGTSFRTDRDKDKRKLYLLSEGTVAAGTSLYEALAPSEIKMREDSAMQRKKLIQNNPTLHLSLTRLSIRNLPRNIDSKALKALAREAVVGFATDVKSGLRAQLSKEEEARGGDEMRDAEKQRKAKGKGIVRQAKIVFEGREGAKVSEDSGAGRSRGYGFVEYSSHRWALMGLRWLNGHALESAAGKKQRLIVEFAIENAQVVQRRKEKEEKARTRSKEVLEAREKGEAPAKEKKVFTKGALMKKTREGMKGKPGRNSEKGGKSFEGVEVNIGKAAGNTESKSKRTSRREQWEEKKGRKQASEKTKPKSVGADGKPFKPGFAPGEEGRLQRREQIVQKKRMMRRKRKDGV